MQRKWEECKTPRECNLYMAEYFQEKAARVRLRIEQRQINPHKVAWARREVANYYAEARDYLFAALDAIAR